MVINFEVNSTLFTFAKFEESVTALFCRDLPVGRRRWYIELQQLMTKSFRAH